MERRGVIPYLWRGLYNWSIKVHQPISALVESKKKNYWRCHFRGDCLTRCQTETTSPVTSPLGRGEGSLNRFCYTLNIRWAVRRWVCRTLWWSFIILPWKICDLPCYRRGSLMSRSRKKQDNFQVSICQSSVSRNRLINWLGQYARQIA
jgi:hypothetical protein